MKFNWRQLFVPLMTLLSTLSAAPALLRRGQPIVAEIYLEAARQLSLGLTPYNPPPAHFDWYRYSPIFAIAYKVFLYVSPSAHLILWAALNSLFFWWGLSKFINFNKKLSGWEWMAIVVASMELNISLCYHQINAALVGALLMGLAAYQKGKLSKAGILLGCISQIKLLPIVFAGALLWPPRKNYIFSLLSTILLLSLLPVLTLGFGANWEMHKQWILSLGDFLVEKRNLDVKTLLENFGFATLAQVSKLSIIIITTALFAWQRFTSQFKDETDWLDWTALGLSALLLLNPGSESPTFVFLAPVYVFFISEPSKTIRSLTLLAMFLCTLIYTDLWPRALKLPLQEFFVTKTLGAFILWCLSCYLILRSRMRARVLVSEGFEN